MRHGRTILVLALLAAPARARRGDDADFDIRLETLRRGYDGTTCWVHPRAGVVPGSPPSVVLTMQKLLLTGSDVFFAVNELRTDDLGRSWRGPTEHGATLGRRDEPDGIVVALGDFWPKWHARSGRLLGIGHTVRYRGDALAPARRRETAYSVYDVRGRTWSAWTTLAMPDEPRFANAGAGSVPRVDLPDGDILLPIYYGAIGERARVTVLRCTFDGSTLRYIEHGDELVLDTRRGLHEPSLARAGDRYLLTIRHDDAGYVTRGRDGLHFEPLREWRWDDGSSLGNYNTQQHWVTHGDTPFLVYTRRRANNDHVFRHRAPLFIARVDPETLRVVRATERVLVPERGARLGNFGVTEVDASETWVTVAEWMQTWGPNFVMAPDNRHGADNSVYAARIVWRTPNPSWNQH